MACNSLFHGVQIGLTASFLVSTTLSASAVSFTEGDLINGDGTQATGQSFVVGLEPSVDPGLITDDVVYLSSIGFASGGELDSVVAPAETYLAVVEGAFFDFNGDPNGSFVPTITSPGVVGVSTNMIDTTGLVYGAPLDFAFGGDVALAYDGIYSAVFVTINEANELTLSPTSTAFIQYEETEPGSGVFIPVANYGGTDNWDATALFPDFDGNGYLEGSTNATDLSFVASFTTDQSPGLSADFNGDGIVDLLDLDILGANWQMAGTGATGDANGDGAVDLLDLDLLGSQWQMGASGSFESALAASGIAVPEPAAIVIFGLAMPAIIRRRR